MIVCKFGGTSVADAAAIGRLIEIIAARRADRPVVVVSALARVTDGLLGLAPLTAAGRREQIDAAIAQLIERHESVAAALPGAETALPTIREQAGALAALLAGAAGRALTPGELDVLAAYGELWSSRLVCAALAGAGIESEWVDARSVVITDNRFTRATPCVELIAERAPRAFGPHVEAGRVPVTQGFIGSTVDGVPTTLGRGGSDFTASLLGAALTAERVEIWTDVDGLMTADPRIVPGARTLRVATYDEGAELATFGAKVLHPATQQPLVRAGIPIVILNSFRPEGAGTMITGTSTVERMGDSPVRSISWKKGITVINIRAPRMLGTYGFLRALFEVFERHEVVVDVLASSEVSVSLTIEDRTRLDAVVRDLEELGEVTVEDGRAIVAVVGIGLRDTSGLAARVFGAVRNINVEVISHGSSSINVTFVVREDDGPEVVRRLHEEFFGNC